MERSGAERRGTGRRRGRTNHQVKDPLQLSLKEGRLERQQQQQQRRHSWVERTSGDKRSPDVIATTWLSPREEDDDVIKERLIRQMWFLSVSDG